MSARTKARKRALDILFESGARGISALTLLEQREETPVTPTALHPYTGELVRGVITNWEVINETISTYARGWSLRRMPAVDRSLLRIGTYEVLYCADVPDAVAISECMKLGRELSTDKSPSFLSGVLNRISEVKDTIAR